MATKTDTFIEKDGVWQEAGTNDAQWAQNTEVKNQDEHTWIENGGGTEPLWTETEVSDEGTDEEPYVSPFGGYDGLWTPGNTSHDMEDHTWIEAGGGTEPLWTETEVSSNEGTDEEPYVSPFGGYDGLWTPGNTSHDMEDHTWIKAGGGEIDRQENTEVQEPASPQEPTTEENEPVIPGGGGGSEPGSYLMEDAKKKKLIMWGLVAAAVILISKR